jgi:hypothetical protein
LRKSLFRSMSGSDRRVEVFECEQVKGIESYRAIDYGIPDIERPAKLGSPLKSLKTGTSRLVQGDQFAVQKQPLERKCPQCLNDFRKAR